MVINRALNKYKHSNFSLEILEYCEPSNVISRVSSPARRLKRGDYLLEQYYFAYNLLNPEYNILKIAGSSLGFKHSEETLKKMRERKHSEETRAKLSKARKGKPLTDKALAKLIGRTLSEKIKAKMKTSALSRLNNNRGQAVKVFDKETNKIYTFSKMSELSKMFAVSIQYFSKRLGRGTNSFLYKTRYLIEKKNDS